MSLYSNEKPMETTQQPSLLRRVVAASYLLHGLSLEEVVLAAADGNYCY